MEIRRESTTPGKMKRKWENKKVSIRKLGKRCERRKNVKKKKVKKRTRDKAMRNLILCVEKETEKKDKQV